MKELNTNEVGVVAFSVDCIVFVSSSKVWRERSSSFVEGFLRACAVHLEGRDEAGKVKNANPLKRAPCRAILCACAHVLFMRGALNRFGEAAHAFDESDVGCRGLLARPIFWVLYSASGRSLGR